MKVIVASLVAVCLLLFMFTFTSTGMSDSEVMESYITNSSFMRSKSQLQGYIDAYASGASAPPQPAIMAEFYKPLPDGAGTLTAKIGWRRDGHDGRLHKGTDIGVNSGTPVYAVLTGDVTSNEFNTSRGYYVAQETNDGSWEAIYQHLREASPKTVGTTVVQQDEIGKSGNTGTSTGPHLHIELILRVENTARYYDVWELIYEEVPVSSADYWVGDRDNAVKYNSKGEEIGKIPGLESAVQFTDYSESR
jgi:murein DD-endopeptidase MepM/ murein hydrolase activator NlpD